MEHVAWLFRLIWIAHAIAISVAVRVEDAAPSPYCPCRLAVECSDGIPSSSEDSSLATSATCESPGMIKCCSVSTANEETSLNETGEPEKIGTDILEDVPRRAVIFTRDLPMKDAAADVVLDAHLPRSDDAATPEFIATNSREHFPQGVVPPIGFAYPEYASTESLPYVPAKDSAYAQPEPYIPRRVTHTDENGKYSPYDPRLIGETTSFESKKTQPKDQVDEDSLSNFGAEDHRSSRVSSQPTKRNVSNQSDLDESGDQSDVNVQPDTTFDTSEVGSFDTMESESLHSGINDSLDNGETMADDAEPYADIGDRGAAGNEPPSAEFGDNAIPGVRTTDRYATKQSMISSSPKDVVPTTTAINSVERKTLSETFLPLDRISVQPINKNTPTTNRSEVTRNNGGGGGGVFTAARRRNPLLSSNAKKIRQFARHRGQSARDNKPRGDALDRRVSPRVENASAERIAVTASIPPRRNDPLEARDDGSTTTLATPALATSQKDTLNENAGVMPEYKNSTVQKEGAKSSSSLGVDRSELGDQEGRKGSADKEDAKTTNAAEPTTVAMPVTRFRFPPRVLPTRPTQPLKKERDPTKNIGNVKRRVPAYFRRFYEGRDNLRSKINNMQRTEMIKSSSVPKSPNGSLSAKKKGTTKVETAAGNLTLKNRVSNVTTANVSASDNSIDSERSSFSSRKLSTSSLRNANPISEEIATHPNASVSMREIEKSMQTGTDRANYASSSAVENAAVTYGRKVAENSERSLKFDTSKDRVISKHVSVESPIGGQLSRDKTQTERHPSEPSGLPVNAMNEQISDVSDQWRRTAHVASNSNTERIIEVSPVPPTIFADHTTTLNDTRNVLSLVTPATSEELDASDERQMADLEEEEKMEDNLHSNTDTISSGDVNETVSGEDISLEMKEVAKDYPFVEEGDERMDKNVDATDDNDYENVDVGSTRAARRKIRDATTLILKRLEPTHDRSGMLRITRRMISEFVGRSSRYDSNLAEGSAMIKEKLMKEGLEDVTARLTQENLYRKRER